MELTRERAQRGREQRQEEQHAEPRGHGGLDEKRDDLLAVSLGGEFRSGSREGKLSDGMHEVNIGQRADYESSTCHGEDKDAADGAGAVELFLTLDCHESHGQLRLRKYANADAEGDGCYDNPPELATKRGHGGEADDTTVLQREAGSFRKGRQGRGERG